MFAQMPTGSVMADPVMGADPAAFQDPVTVDVE